MKRVEKDKGRPVKEWSVKDGGFEANGRIYKIEVDTMCVARWEEFVAWELACAGYNSYKDFNQRNEEAIGHFNKGDHALLGKHLIDNRIYFSFNESKIDPVLMMCALFINREDEDRSVYDENFMKEKVKDWREEGLDVLPFFECLILRSPTLKQGYINYIQTISTEEKKPIKM